MTRLPGLDPSQVMRAMLATEGIFLEETPAIAPTVAPATIDPPIDRALVREMLSERGAPDRDLDWLTRSCISVEHALAFEPTPWMLRDFGDHINERPSAAKGRP